MKTKITISIIVPIYNGEKHLNDCLNSLLRQTVENYEIICIDDGSTDSSSIILESYAKRFSHLQVIRTENSGVWKAREKGIQFAKGEYIGFCDCDDKVNEEMYQILYEILKREQSDMAVCAYNRVEGQTKKKIACEMNHMGNKTIEVSKNRGNLAGINTSLWNKLIRTEIVKKYIRLKKPPRVGEDMLFLLSIYPFIKKISFYEKPLYEYNIWNNSAMSYMKKSELKGLIKGMYQTKKYIIKQGEENWREVADLFAFIHFGIVFVFKISDGNYREMKKIHKKMIEIMDKYFDTWRRSRYLSFRTIFLKNNFLRKPILVKQIYQTYFFDICLEIYTLLIKRLKIDIKW